MSGPEGSGAALLDQNSANPYFFVDRSGTYEIQLIVSDGYVDSVPDSVLITTENSAPVADAGSDQIVPHGNTVYLDGSGSSDADNDPLVFSWSIIAGPEGSQAVLEDPSAIITSFAADQPGMYLIQLIVNDGEASSEPDTVSITTESEAPIADAGADHRIVFNHE